MKDYFFHEAKIFLKNKKNQVSLFLLLFASLYYALVLVDQYEPIQQVNPTQIEARYQDRQEFLDSFVTTDGTYPLASYAFYVFPRWNELDHARLQALEKKDWQTYAQKTSEWYEYSDFVYMEGAVESLRYDTQYYRWGNWWAKDDGHFAYRRETNKYRAFATVDKSLSINAFEERTALQVFVRLSQKLLPILLLTLLIVLMSDVVVVDYRHKSIVNNYPVTAFQRMLCKMGLVPLALLAMLLVLFPSFSIISFKYGLGSFSYPVPIYFNQLLGEGTFQIISIGQYLGLFVGILGLWMLLVTAFIFVSSQLFKNEIVNILLALLIVFGEAFYFSRGSGEFKPIEFIPSSFINIGEVITGYKNFLYATEKISLSSSLYVLLPLLLILMILMYLFSKRRSHSFD